MNLKFLTTTVFLLTVCFHITAQINGTTQQAPIGNTVDIQFTISDVNAQQVYELGSEHEYFVNANIEIDFRINLNYESELLQVGYFGISYQMYKINRIGSIDDLLYGVTRPVLIPPTRRRRSRTILDQYGTYPFTIETLRQLTDVNSSVRMYLIKYDSEYDYVNQTANYSVVADTTFDLILVNDVLARNAASDESVLTYPNPTTNFLIFEYPATATETTEQSVAPIEVTIYNDKGKTLSKQVILGVKTNDRIRYQLSTETLTKGTYYCKIKRGDQAVVKTIIKK